MKLLPVLVLLGIALSVDLLAADGIKNFLDLNNLDKGVDTQKRELEGDKETIKDTEPAKKDELEDDKEIIEDTEPAKKDELEEDFENEVEDDSVDSTGDDSEKRSELEVKENMEGLSDTDQSVQKRVRGFVGYTCRYYSRKYFKCWRAIRCYHYNSRYWKCYSYIKKCCK
ncbi:uncharacterized protein LOC102354589 [Latimeria chalumnae]|uniref:uncharacterized protein LOC102354589 n=1 Tax=Latimeria chalumnae TaxID=7897 RepID=UPI00313EEE51